MGLSAGTRLGVYEIRAAIGEGGMGEVYRARDTRLQRDVALKILPEAFWSDAERLARFEREAQMLAAINHPHIAAIHGIEESEGIRALVLELVDGDTIADRIAAGPMPLADVISMATQIAEALEAAHEQGIIHRDLKPSNIKVRPDGTVKVLDFGLAKLASGISHAGSKEQDPAYTVSPTITTPAMTQIGVIVGTAAYMSPEQAKGREADKRSDVWAFGAVLFEMLTGTRAFDGDDMSDTLASVLKSEPDWTTLPSDVPPAMRTLVRRCLTKDRRQRVSDLSAARFVLTEIASIESSMPAGGRAGSGDDQARSWTRSVLLIAATALLTTIVVGVALYVWRPLPQPPAVVRFAYTPAGQSFSGNPAQVVAISADGTKVAYTADQRLYLRSLSELEPRAVTESALLMLNPVFAPDGESLLYVTLSEGGPTLRRIPFRGGAASTIGTFPDAPGFSGISWGRDGILMAVLGGKGGILRVNERGGTPERLVPTGRDEIIHGPQMLPGARTILFTVARVVGDDRWDKAQIVAQSLVDGNRRVLVEGGSDGRYVSSGHLLYAVGGTIYAAPFDPNSLVVGRAAPVISGVRRATGGQTGATHLAISETGTLAYVPGPATGFSNARSLVVGNGRDQPIALKAPVAVYAHPRVSSDGRLLAVARNDDASSDIWTYDLSGTMAMQRLTLGGGSRFPVWSADGRRVTFQSMRDGDAAIWWQHIAGGTAERLTRPAKDEAHVPEAWSRDGTRLLFSVRKGDVNSLWVFTLAERKAKPFGKVESAESLSATFSPDGRWVAYASTPRSGGTVSPNRGVFVEPFPPTGLKRQVPKTLLDYHPVWAPDGKSILYIAGSSRPTVSVPVTTQPTLTFGTPVDLPRAPAPGLVSVDVRGYDLLPDGRLVSVAGADATTTPGVDIRIVLNWFEELRRLVPTQ